MIWIGLVISFQKIYGLCGIKGHIVERRWDVTFVHGRTTECEDSARILKQNSQYQHIKQTLLGLPNEHLVHEHHPQPHCHCQLSEKYELYRKDPQISAPPQSYKHPVHDSSPYLRLYYISHCLQKILTHKNVCFDHENIYHERHLHDQATSVVI